MRRIVSRIGTRATASVRRCSPAAVSTCATNPVTGKKELSFVSESQEIHGPGVRRPGRRRRWGSIPTPAVQRYVSGIGRGLAGIGAARPALDLHGHGRSAGQRLRAARRLHLHHPRHPGAHELRGRAGRVLGHEIGHVTARHSVQQMTRQQLAQIGLVAGAHRLGEGRPEPRARSARGSGCSSSSTAGTTRPRPTGWGSATR